MLGNWACRRDGDWVGPLRRWLDTRGCDVLALLHEFDDPLTYAARWLRVEWLAHPDEYGPALDRWLSYYRACGIDAIASGAVVVRKRRGVNWFQEFSVGAEMHGFSGEQLHRLLRIQDYCIDHLRTAEEILDCRLELQHHTLRQVLCDMAAQLDVNVDDMISPALASVRTLIERGFLLPVGLSGT